MNQKKKVNLKETGITLLALVVTIIVLLILAGITISLVLGENGIINRAQNAHQTNAEAKIIEEIQLAWGAVQVDALPKGWNNQAKSDGLQTELRKEDSTSTTSLADPIITVTYKGYETTINAGTGSMSALAKSTPDGDDGIPGEKVSTDNLNAGDHIMIKLKGITDPVECVVLYDKTSEHASNGVQVITVDTIGNPVTLGADGNGQDQWIPASMANESYVEKAKWSYNNAIDNLNAHAESYMDTNYVVGARCVGSDPDNPRDNSPFLDGLTSENVFEYGYREEVDSFVKTLKSADSNIYNENDNSGDFGSECKDLEQMEYLKIIATGDFGSPVYKSFWLASRRVCARDIYNCWFDIYGFSDESIESAINGYYNLLEPYNGAAMILNYYDHASQDWNFYSGTRGFRPCFTLKSGIFVSRISENGIKGPRWYEY